MQQCLPSEYAGKRVRMSGYMKSQDVAGWAGFWFRVDGQGARSLAFDNMHGRAVRGTTGWKKYEIVLDVPQQATNLAYGALLDGTGKIWFSDLSFEVVDRSVATTNESGWDALPKPSNLDFSE